LILSTVLFQKGIGKAASCFSDMSPFSAPVSRSPRVSTSLALRLRLWFV